MKQRIRIFLAIVTIMGLVLPCIGLTGGLAKVEPPPIYLKFGIVMPNYDNILSLETAAATTAGGLGYFIVQFRGPVQEAWKTAVSQQGVELLDYLPDFAFKVCMSASRANAVRQSEYVAWVGPFHAAY